MGMNLDLGDNVVRDDSDEEEEEVLTATEAISVQRQNEYPSFPTPLISFRRSKLVDTQK